MLYSLLVPCYNSEKFLEGFLNNIAKLIKPFDEILFYDDASTDNTVSVLRAKGYTVIEGEVNRGAGFARNVLAAHANGEWIHFHDIDDFLDPAYLKETAPIALTNRYDVILCNVDWYDSTQSNIMLSWIYSDEKIKQAPLEYTISNPIGGINGLYRKEKFTKTGGFNTTLRIWEDADLHVKLAACNARFYVIEKVLSIAVRHENSASSNQVSGWLNRLSLLTSYQQQFTGKDTQKVIGQQAQFAASRLIMAQQYAAAKSALKLSELCGLKVPDNSNPVWSLLRFILPASFRVHLRMTQLKIAFKKNINA